MARFRAPGSWRGWAGGGQSAICSPSGQHRTHPGGVRPVDELSGRFFEP